MERHVMRRKYFIHPSSQFKYIGMTILPALIMSLFCTYFLLRSGEIFLAREKHQVNSEISFIDETINAITRQQDPADAALRARVLKERLSIVGQNLEIQYFKTMEKWATTKMTVILLLSVTLAFAGTLSLLFSHRVAGPLLRMRRSIDMLADGKDIPPFCFRSYDEFKELAASLERLHKSMKEKGLLKPPAE